MAQSVQEMVPVIARVVRKDVGGQGEEPGWLFRPWLLGNGKTRENQEERAELLASLLLKQHKFFSGLISPAPRNY